jgi:hypothetical protein
MQIIFRALAIISVLLGLIVITSGGSLGIITGIVLLVGLPILFSKAAVPAKQSINKNPKNSKDKEDTSWYWAIGISLALLATYLFKNYAYPQGYGSGWGDFGISSFVMGIIALSFLTKALLVTITNISSRR